MMIHKYCDLFIARPNPYVIGPARRIVLFGQGPASSVLYYEHRILAEAAISADDDRLVDCVCVYVCLVFAAVPLQAISPPLLLPQGNLEPGNQLPSHIVTSSSSCLCMYVCLPVCDPSTHLTNYPRNLDVFPLFSMSNRRSKDAFIDLQFAYSFPSPIFFSIISTKIALK